MKILAEKIIEIFFKQVFQDSFFHGDMHPGNIFVNENNLNLNNLKYISIIDCGIVGSVNKHDKYYLASNFIAFLNRDYRKIAELHIDSGWIPINTNIEDFESSIRTIFEPIFEQPLKNIFFSEILLYLLNVAKNFHMDIQPQLILFQKTLLYIEGIIKQLYPHLNLWEYIAPFFKKWISDQLKLSKIIFTIKENIPHWINKIPEIPDLLYKNIQHSHIIQKNIESLLIELRTKHKHNNQILFLFGIGSILIISSILLFIQNHNLYISSISLFILGIFVWLIGWKRTIY